MSRIRASGGAPRRVARPRSVTASRWVAWESVARTFDDDAWTDRVFAAGAERAGLDGRDRAFAQFLAYGTVQHVRTLDHVIATVGSRPLGKVDPSALHALRLGAFQLLMAPGIAQHAAVDQSVEIVRAAVGHRAVGFANAVLRRVQADGPAIVAALDPADLGECAVLLSFPDWMVRRMHDAFGLDGIDALAAQNRATPTLAAEVSAPGGGAIEGMSVGASAPSGGAIGGMSVDETVHARGVGDAVPSSGAAGAVQPTLTPMRCNALAGGRDAATASLDALGVSWHLPSGAFTGALEEVVLVEGATGVVQSLIDEGLLVPQSLSSCLVAHAVAPEPGDRVLDMCAAPGGKTTHLAALLGGRGEVVACDLHQHRAESIAALAARTGASDVVTVITADATTLTADANGTFDRVLVDAPCSGLGVLDRRPDARWKRSEQDIAGLVDLQRRLLATAAHLVRPGGTVVYSTCTLLPEEDEQVVAHAIASGALVPDPLPATVPDWFTLPDAPHLARVWPHVHGSDGFFVARLRRGDAT